MSQPSTVDRVEQFSDEVQEATMSRNVAIRDMRAEGYSLREIAAAANLSHTAVAKILAR